MPVFYTKQHKTTKCRHFYPECKNNCTHNIAYFVCDVSNGCVFELTAYSVCNSCLMQYFAEVSSSGAVLGYSMAMRKLKGKTCFLVNKCDFEINDRFVNDLKKVNINLSLKQGLKWHE